MTLEINTQETELLTTVLEKEEKILLIEINRANHREFKDLLKERLKILNALIEKLKVS
ncbi:MAG: hypothetical protein Q8928_16380 [Bacteroidota bacterium]|nr:hypothetical protein [Bacteroidota bacterium]